jgi:hypothetical protein
VDAHVRSCDRCREELALAREALTAVKRLPEEAVPFGATREVVRGARRPSAWARPGVWAAAGAAAVVVGIFVFFSMTRLGEDGVTQLSGGADAPAAEAPSAVEPQAESGATGEATLSSAAGYPLFRESKADHTAESLNEKTRRLASEARAALGSGFPSTPQAFYEQVDLRSIEPAASEALECATSGAPPGPNVVPFVLEGGRFEGIPAYLVSFLQAPSPEAAYERVQLQVVDRGTCSVKHFAQQKL